MDYEESEIIGNEGVSLCKTIHPHFLHSAVLQVLPNFRARPTFACYRRDARIPTAEKM
jgi:hypothetical protein